MTTSALTRYVSAHCYNGGHENAKRLSPGGALMPACRGDYVYRFVKITCHCWCHEMFRAMAAEQASALDGPSSDTVGTDVPTTAILGPLDASSDSRVDPTIDAGSDEAELNFWGECTTSDGLSPQLRRFINKHIYKQDVSNMPDLKDNRYDEAKRRARGSLDINVEVVCRLWLDSRLPYEHLRPNDIAVMIDANDPPSSGAIYAVLKRWEQSNFVELETDPFRFIRFSPTVGEKGISFTKDALTRERKARAKGFF